MGGDLAPAATVEGAVRAHRERGLEVVLVGDEPRLRIELRRLGAGESELRVHHASEVVEMAEHPGQALRRKKDSSIRVCFDLCKSKQVKGMVSAGNSGAVLAAGPLLLRPPPRAPQTPPLRSPPPASRAGPGPPPGAAP